ncbi:NGG1 interacting factor Nif3, putative [Talaromyces stipitatus ATCC 10500]|uniref:NGG1 interacting factor Nif3, putative n=1 Tax=Talaromyces stipitatus (strain ATCC 10500 / CBS 375.48 / QM 6759 / NRRL 1006) TaxID=441959 RepID=B8MCW7_TALSN|nr:NGG1 interacting factor Nif3, putative [Talaromyces stipitatus ATCC 10500]EED17493.1 NGG1 interacting factor Nif3, putative [Talaromyces stipitatus ATCC 10500]
MKNSIRSILSNSVRSRWSSTMAQAPAISPFSQAVVNTMRKLYPESLADKTFDNTGLLLESPYTPNHNLKNTVLLTTDLTKAVADEAIARRDSIIITYHPIIFRGLKSLTLQDTQQTSLLRLAQEGISVYSPHTAVDAVPGGMADWLCDIVSGKFANTAPTAIERTGGGSYSAVIYPQPTPNQQTSTSVDAHTRVPIRPSPEPVPTGFEGAGAGRLLTFSTPQPLSTLLDRIGAATGCPGSISLAIPQGRNVSSIQIRTVGVCPGSGSSILMNPPSGVLPDLLFTGELSHHEALAAVERGSAVVTVFHSNSERGYLWDVMRRKLEDGIVTQLGIQEQGEVVAVSKVDRDPFGVVVRK